MTDKVANEELPQDLQDTINTFIKQSEIIEEYNLDSMPIEYFINLINKLYAYKNYTAVMDLLDILERAVEIKRKLGL